MNNFEAIQSMLIRTARRQRWQRAWKGLWWGCFYGALLWLLAVILYKLAPITDSAPAWGGVLFGICCAAGFLWGFVRRIDLRETARWLDLKEQWNERLSTAIEAADKERLGEWRELLIADASRHVSEFDPKRALPLSLPLVSRWVVLLLVVGVGLGFVPEYRSSSYLQRERDAEVIKEVGQQLAILTKRNLDQRPPVLPATKESLEHVAHLGMELSKAKVTRAEALKDLASATDRLKDALNELGRDRALQAMERAARTPSQGGEANAQMQRHVEAVERLRAQEGGTGEESIQRLQDKLDQVKAAAQGLQSGGDGGQAAAAQQQLAQALESLAKQAAEMGLDLPDLQDAIDALASAEIGQLIEGLDAAGLDLEALKKAAQNFEKLKAQQQQIGKTLGEQLERGQASAAKGSLERMMKQLQSGQFSAEELDKMLQELAEAVDPAEPYGAAAQHLAKAVQQLKANQKPGAKESLQAAADELERLMEQFGDCKSMAATLDALRKAQMCVGNCQGWGLGGTKPGVGQGGNPGAGVGTWADDSRWLDAANQQSGWDNSGLVRPDMDARGVSEREAALSENLTATKVKGQFNPGSAMPSMTLKGVSIRGMSKVQVQEVLNSAQSEAQSALSQDQVPRAYQGAVRDYFDEIK